MDESGCFFKALSDSGLDEKAKKRTVAKNPNKDSP